MGALMPPPYGCCVEERCRRGPPRQAWGAPGPSVPALFAAWRRQTAAVLRRIAIAVPVGAVGCAAPPRPGLRAACGGCRGLVPPPAAVLGLSRSWRRPAPGRWGPGAWWASWRGGVAPRPGPARRRARPVGGFPPSAALGLAVAVAWCPGRGPPRGGKKCPWAGCSAAAAAGY